MTVDAKTLRDTLKALGSGPNAVARRLIAAGVYGVPEDGQYCAIAEYLKVQFPGEEVEVDGQQTVVNGAKVKTPTACSSFIVQFDDKVLPELVAHAYDCTGVRRSKDDWDGSWLVDCGCGRVWRAFFLYEDSDPAKASRAYLKRAERGALPVEVA